MAVNAHATAAAPPPPPSKPCGRVARMLFDRSPSLPIGHQLATQRCECDACLLGLSDDSDSSTPPAPVRALTRLASTRLASPRFAQPFAHPSRKSLSSDRSAAFAQPLAQPLLEASRPPAVRRAATTSRCCAAPSLLLLLSLLNEPAAVTLCCC